MKAFRYFDLEHWQMREALGYPIPSWVDRRFRRKLAGNGGSNPFECGKCVARRIYPTPVYAEKTAAPPYPFGNVPFI